MSLQKFSRSCQKIINHKRKKYNEKWQINCQYISSAWIAISDVDKMCFSFSSIEYWDGQMPSCVHIFMGKPMQREVWKIHEYSQVHYVQFENVSLFAFVNFSLLPKLLTFHGNASSNSCAGVRYLNAYSTK
jgi:hypothetical protein